MRIFVGISKQLENLRSASLNLLIFAAVILGVAIFGSALLRQEVEIHPFELPKELVERGYNGEVASKRTVDKIYEIFRGSRTTRELSGFTSYSREGPLSNVDLHVGGMSLPVLVGHLRRYLGFTDTRITGEVVVTHPPIFTAQGDRLFATLYSLRLRIIGTDIIHWNLEPKEDLAPLLDEAAVRLVEHFEPYAAAAYYLEQREFERARQMIEKCLTNRSSDDDLWALNLRGLLARDERRRSDELAEFERLIRDSPQFPLPYINYSRALYERGKPGDRQNAVRLALHSAIIDPNPTRRALALHNAALALQIMARRKEAFDFSDAALAGYPIGMVAWLYFGVSINDGAPPDVDGTRRMYAHATEPGSSDGRLLANWADLERSERNLDVARRLAEKATQADYSRDAGYYQLGRLDFDVDGHLDDAIRNFRRAIEINPKSADGNHYLGLALQKRGELDQALQQFDAAARLNATYPWPKLRWVQTTIMKMETSGDSTPAQSIELAVAKLDEVLEIALDQTTLRSRDLSRLLVEIGDAYRKLRKFEQADRVVQMAEKVVNDD